MRARWASEAIGRLLRRHPVAGVFVGALIVRVVTAVVLFVVADGTLFSDDRTYSTIAEAEAEGRLDELVSYASSLYERTAVLTYPLAALYRVFGPSQLMGQLYVAVAGAATAAMTVVLARRLDLPTMHAVAAGAVVALLPSQVLWSSLVLKDAFVWLASATAGVAVLSLVRTTGWRAMSAIAVLGGVILGLGWLREHTLVIVAWSAMAALLVAIVVQRRPLLLAGVLVAVFVPVWHGLGPAGASFVASAPSFEAERIENAERARTALVPVPVTTVPRTVPKRRAVEEDFADIVGRLPRGTRDVLLRPVPGEAGSTAIRLASAETVLWYALLVGAVLGVATLVRRRETAAVYPVVFGLAMTAVLALTEGNLGTAIRHRGELVWVAAVLAAVGLSSWHAGRKVSSTETP